LAVPDCDHGKQKKVARLLTKDLFSPLQGDFERCFRCRVSAAGNLALDVADQMPKLYTNQAIYALGHR
jgi:hypothetical protein